MPEGDTIRRTALRLRAALVGRTLTRFEAPRLHGRPPAIGERLDAVSSRGKHLLVDFSGGLTLRTHLRMNGSWHLYRGRERWQQPAHLARVVIGVDDGWVAVGFRIPDVATFDRRGALPRPLAGLGPDLAADLVELAAVVVRAREVAALDPAMEVAEVLLDQRVAAGIGNVYKSEILFLCRVSPFQSVVDLSDDVLATLYGTAHDLLVRNRDRTRRATHGTGLAVYDRTGQPCPRCGSSIRAERQGVHRRTTFWCPGCQS